MGAIWAPFWHQKSTNIEEYSPPKGYQKWVRFLYRFLLNFGSILGALLEPCSPPRGPQDGPRAAQDAFRRRLGGVLEPGAAQEAPRPPPGLDSRPPDLEFGASRPEFWEVFTCNMDANWHQKSCYISFLSPPEIHAYIHIHIYIYIYIHIYIYIYTYTNIS